jgi:hypothetical protein
MSCASTGVSWRCGFWRASTSSATRWGAAGLWGECSSSCLAAGALEKPSQGRVFIISPCRCHTQEERGPLTAIITTTFPALLSILHAVLANPSAGVAVGLSPSHYVKLILKVFWSATFMGIPDILLADDQFQGWMGGLHDVLRRHPPAVRAGARMCARARGTHPIALVVTVVTKQPGQAHAALSPVACIGSVPLVVNVRDPCACLTHRTDPLSQNNRRTRPLPTPRTAPSGRGSRRRSGRCTWRTASIRAMLIRHAATPATTLTLPSASRCAEVLGEGSQSGTPRGSVTCSGSLQPS